MKPKTIEDYIDSANPAAKSLMRALLACLREVAPNAEEGIKWGAPTFTQGRILFSFESRKNDIGFFPHPSSLKAFAEELEDLETTRTSIKLPLDKPLPKELIRSIASYRLRDVVENDARWM